VAPYFDIATKYGFANYFFQTNQGPSMPAHQFLFSGTSAPSGIRNQGYWNYFQAENPLQTGDTGCTAAPTQTVKLVGKSGIEDGTTAFPCFNHNSLPSLLDPNHISWKYYGSGDNHQPGPTGIWTAPNAIYDICFPPDQTGTVCTGSDWVNDVVFGTSQILHDLGVVSSQECGLRNVSWVIPNGDRSDHPGFQGQQNDSHQIEGGPAWVADIINAVGNSPCTDTVNSVQVPYWQDTAIFIVWDDWGGFWDHVQPYEVLYDDPAHNKHCDPSTTFGCGYVSGFRVPFLVVSAYTGAHNQDGTYSGYVSGACQSPNCPNEAFPFKHDFGSILAFIENNFLGFNAIGSINKSNNYPFADAFAPDFRLQPSNIPLADFFPLTTPRPFQAITVPAGAPSATDFINYNGPILDPDNDAVDND
jgi:phospholipase C